MKRLETAVDIVNRPDVTTVAVDVALDGLEAQALAVEQAVRRQSARPLRARARRRRLSGWAQAPYADGCVLAADQLHRLRGPGQELAVEDDPTQCRARPTGRRGRPPRGYGSARPRSRRRRRERPAGAGLVRRRSFVELGQRGVEQTLLVLDIAKNDQVAVRMRREPALPAPREYRGRRCRPSDTKPPNRQRCRSSTGRRVRPGCPRRRSARPNENGPPPPRRRGSSDTGAGDSRVDCRPAVH